MTTRALLTSLLRYKAGVDAELLDVLGALMPDAKLHAALRVLNHFHTVDCIFAANLENRDHAFAGSWSDAPPSLAQLSADVRALDRWYLDYISAVDEEALEEGIGFTFTDGGRGRMTRAEMLAHVVTHAGYHRGEIGRLLPEIETAAARDVFAGYLHRTEPSRRN